MAAAMQRLITDFIIYNHIADRRSVRGKLLKSKNLPLAGQKVIFKEAKGNLLQTAHLPAVYNRICLCQSDTLHQRQTICQYADIFHRAVSFVRHVRHNGGMPPLLYKSACIIIKETKLFVIKVILFKFAEV